MSYKKRTEFFRIPYISAGEEITEIAEEVKAKIVDNQLLVATCGLSTAIIEDGEYSLIDNGDKTYTLIMSPYGEFSLMGILNRRLFYSTQNIYCDNLRSGNYYYIYLVYKEEMDVNPRDFKIEVSLDSYAKSTYRMMLCIVDLRTEPKVISDPDDKIYTKNILAHANDSSNPHGRKLYQDSLEVKKELKINGNEIYETIYENITSGGAGNPIEVAVDRVIKFVTVTPIEGGLGNYWVEIGKNTLTLFNDGKKTNCLLEIKVK